MTLPPETRASRCHLAFLMWFSRLSCCGVAALPGGQEQHRTLHPGVQLGRVVLPQGFDVERLERREASVAAAAGSVPRSKVVWLEDSVHDVPLQRPELVASVLREYIQEGFFG